MNVILEMDSEEDVIFEDSPLAKHLKECGIKAELEKKDVGTTAIKKTLGEKLTHSFWGMAKGSLHVEYPKYAYEVYRDVLLLSILESKLLLYDDMEFLMDSSPSASKCRDARKKMIKTIVAESLVASATSVALFMSGYSWRPATLLSILPATVMIFRWRNLILAQKELRKTVYFLKLAAKYDDIQRKALRIIGDYSLISQGYMMSQKSSQVWRLETSQIQELSSRSRSSLPGLRFAVMKTSQRMALQFSAATCHLKKERPLPEMMDHHAFYLPDFDIGTINALVEEKGEENAEATLPSLRMIEKSVQILQLKQSEYLRRMWLGLLATRVSDTFDVPISNSLQEELLSCLTEMEISMALHQPYVSKTKKEGKPDEKKMIRNKDSLGLDLGSCYRSCCIHLEEALSGSKDLEETIENCSDTSSLDANKLTESLSKVLLHVESASSCLQRATILTSKLNSSIDPQEADPPIIKADSVQSDVETRASVEDYIPQDEVFELYMQCEDGIKANVEEDVKDKVIDGKYVSVMMKELRSVLKFKAADWKEREKRVKLRNRSGTGDKCMDDVSSGSDSMDELEGEDKKFLVDSKDVKKAGRNSFHLKIASDVSGSSSALLNECDSNSNDSTRWMVLQEKRLAEANENAAERPEVPISGNGGFFKSLAAEAVAKAKANHPREMGLMEEQFEILGDDEKSD